MPVTIVAGPDEYLFGEEKALLEVIEGSDPLPRCFPPYQHGLFATVAAGRAGRRRRRAGRPGGAASNPTLVNNVETLANVPHILARGAEWFRSMGTERVAGHDRVHRRRRRGPRPAWPRSSSARRCAR